MFLTSDLTPDFRAFDHHISFNQSLKRGATVVVSDMMKTLYKETISEGSFAKLLVGPHGVGKTTTLFWLCHQLAEKGAIALPINIDVINKFIGAPPKILLVDLNEINSIPLPAIPDIVALRRLKMEVIASNGKVIFAASSSYSASASYSVDNRKASAIRNLYLSFKKITINIAPSTAELVVKQLFPDILDADKANLLDRTNCLPGLITLYTANEGYEKDISQHILSWWWKEYKAFTSNQCINTRKLFLALYYNRSILAVALTIDDVSILPPMLCNLMFLDENLVPQMYLKLKNSSIEHIIKTLTVEVCKSAISDEEASVGFCFELPAFNALSRTTLEIVDKSSKYFNLSLPDLYVMPVRYDKDNTTNIQSSALYQMPLQSHGIDGFFKLDSDVFGNTCTSILVLLQISVKQDGHNQKVQSVALVPLMMYDMIKEVKHVVYLYVNPKVSSNVVDLSEYFFRSIPKKLQSVTWYFSLPENICKFVDAYHFVKRLMKP